MLNTARLKTPCLAGLAVLLGACAHPIVISPTPEAIRGPVGGTKIEKQVAYVISPENRAKQVETPGGGGDKISYFPYRDLEVALYQSLSEVFQKVRVVASPKEAQQQADVDFVLIPTLSTTSSSSSIMTWPPTDFQLTIDTQVVDRQGAKRWEGTVSGKGHAEFSEFVKDYPLAARRASAEAIKQFRDSLSKASPQFEGASPQAAVSVTALAVAPAQAAPAVVAAAPAPAAVAVAAPVAAPVAVAPAPVAVAAPAKVAVAAAAPAPVTVSNASAQALGFDPSKAKQGPWSYEVEQLAKLQGCVGSGAWLVAKEEWTERYIVSCERGGTFVASCNRDGACLAG